MAAGDDAAEKRDNRSKTLPAAFPTPEGYVTATALEGLLRAAQKHDGGSDEEEDEDYEKQIDEEGAMLRSTLAFVKMEYV